jgi:hypothetical protein
MELIKRYNEDTNIKWWKECRIIANKAIDKFNHWQLGDEKITARDAFIQFGLSYIDLKDESVSYADTFDVMKSEFEKEGFNVSFYLGWQ